MVGPIGILALQGDVREHGKALDELGASWRPVRRPADLEGISGIILPGGESTTLSMLLESSELFEPLDKALHEGLPVFGTCAGLVLLASELLDGRPDQRVFGMLDCSVRRNGYGRQVASFEGQVTVDPRALDAATPGAGPVPTSAAAPTWTEIPAVFIQAPVIETTGPEVDVLGRLSRRPGEPPLPVLCRQRRVLACAFHPELTPDRRLHRLFLSMVAAGSPDGR